MDVTYEHALGLLRQRLGDGSLEHCVRVGETARQLALAYSVDQDEARLAGLLHDWDRELDHDSLLAAASASGHEPTAAETRSPRLLHARTGAAALRESIPGISPAIAQAVERHTLGAVDMEPLDMVVYVADMIEPGRAYPGVDELRSAVGVAPLSELFAEAFRSTVLHLVESRKHIHPLTVDVWNAHVARSAS